MELFAALAILVFVGTCLVVGGLACAARVWREDDDTITRLIQVRRDAYDEGTCYRKGMEPGTAGGSTGTGVTAHAGARRLATESRDLARSLLDNGETPDHDADDRE